MPKITDKKIRAVPGVPRQSRPGARMGTPSKKENPLQRQPGDMRATRRPMKKGGALRPIDKSKNPGLAKLPTKVRNKMGFMKDGGVAKRNKVSQAIFRNIGTKDAFKKSRGK